MSPVRLGQHELLVRLAAGGAANVFLVRDLASANQDRLVALKILLPSLASNEDFLNMFFAEARIASRLTHRNVVAITGFGQVQGIHCLAMEYVFGASLAQVLRESARAKKPLTVGVLLRITADVCDALHYAHEKVDEEGQSMGLVHRDVTPQNILISYEGVPKLTDFGIAKATGRGWETQAGIVKGKFSYMSPEQALGKKVDRRSDIFGAGIVLWEALTGRDLFKGSTAMDVLTAVREQKIEPPSKVVPGLTPIVDPIVMRALRRSPRQRYQTAAEMRDDILELIHRAGVQIDHTTIAKEFGEIYGRDEIASRAFELKKAQSGKADLDRLADVLGGQPLNQKHIPVVPGGVTDPDPLGLFPGRAPEAPVNGEETGTRTDFEIVDVVSEVFARPELEGVTEWNEGAGGRSPADDDDLLSMLSEEDATIGHIPRAFAERIGHTQPVSAADVVGFDDDEATVGVPAGAELSPMRPLSDDPSGDWSDPPAYYDEPPRARIPGGDVRASQSLEPLPLVKDRDASTHRGPAPAPPGAASTRPIPRAPSLDLEEADRTPPPPQVKTPPPPGLEPEPEPTPAMGIEAQTLARTPPPAVGDVAPVTDNPLGHGVALAGTGNLPRPRVRESDGVQLPWPAFVLLVLCLLGIGYAAGLMLPRPF